MASLTPGVPGIGLVYLSVRDCDTGRRPLRAWFAVVETAPPNEKCMRGKCMGTHLQVGAVCSVLFDCGATT